MNIKKTVVIAVALLPDAFSQQSPPPMGQPSPAPQAADRISPAGCFLFAANATAPQIGRKYSNCTLEECDFDPGWPLERSRFFRSV